MKKKPIKFKVSKQRPAAPKKSAAKPKRGENRISELPGDGIAVETASNGIRTDKTAGNAPPRAKKSAKAPGAAKRAEAPQKGASTDKKAEAVNKASLDGPEADGRPGGVEAYGRSEPVPQKSETAGAFEARDSHRVGAPQKGASAKTAYGSVDEAKTRRLHDDRASGAPQPEDEKKNAGAAKPLPENENKVEASAQTAEQPGTGEREKVPAERATEKEARTKPRRKRAVRLADETDGEAAATAEEKPEEKAENIKSPKTCGGATDSGSVAGAAKGRNDVNASGGDSSTTKPLETDGEITRPETVGDELEAGSGSPENGEASAAKGKTAAELKPLDVTEANDGGAKSAKESAASPGKDGDKSLEARVITVAIPNPEAEPAPPKKLPRFIAAAACVAALAAPLAAFAAPGLSLNRIYVDREPCDAVVSSLEDARAVLKAAGVALRSEDEVETSGEAWSLIREINVYRASPVSLTADGVKKEVYVRFDTVAECLENNGIALGEFDEVSPSLDTVLAEGDEIVVKRVSYSTRTVTEAVPWREVTKLSPLLALGKLRLMNSGGYRDGVAEVTYQDRYVDGALESSEAVSTRYTTFPYNAVTLEGDPSAALSPLDGSKYTDVEIINNVPSSYISVKEGQPCTAYSFKPGVWGASGMYLVQGMVAVNPDEYDYGQLLYITSADGSFVYGWAIVADAGEAMMDGRVEIDCFFETYMESVLFGKHYMNVYVVDQLTQSELEEYAARPGYFQARVPE